MAIIFYLFLFIRHVPVSFYLVTVIFEKNFTAIYLNYKTQLKIKYFFLCGGQATTGGLTTD